MKVRQHSSSYRSGFVSCVFQFSVAYVTGANLTSLAQYRGGAWCRMSETPSLISNSDLPPRISPSIVVKALAGVTCRWAAFTLQAAAAALGCLSRRAYSVCIGL